MKTIATLLGATALVIAVDSYAQPGPPAGVPPGQSPVPTVDTSAFSSEQGVTITVSQTFTNDTNAITVVGVVDSEQQKQDVQTKLQEALPGKMVNNYLIVSNQTQTITEPAGAEKEDIDKSEDQEQPDQPELNEQPEDQSTDPTATGGGVDSGSSP